MTDDQNNWLVTAKALITDAFMSELEEWYDLDTNDAALRTEITQGAALYIRDFSHFDNSDIEREKRNSYKRLKKETARFKGVLASEELDDLEIDLYWAAVHMKADAEECAIPEIGALKPQSGKASLLELDRLLGLLEKAADLGIDNFAPNRGPKPNSSLQNLVRRIAFIWAELLKRPFTVDYHGGTGITEAFSFVETVVKQIDANYSATEIVTAMRIIITERGL